MSQVQDYELCCLKSNLMRPRDMLVILEQEKNYRITDLKTVSTKQTITHDFFHM